MTNEKRTIDELRAGGWQADRCTYWTHGRWHDLFGFADVAAYGGPWTLLVQATDTTHQSLRTRKLADMAACRAWIEGPRLLAVAGWRKYAHPDASGRLWRVTWTWLERGDLPSGPLLARQGELPDIRVNA
jgi:hypothetical protein